MTNASRAKAKDLALKILPASASILDLNYAIDQIGELFEEIATLESAVGDPPTAPAGGGTGQ